MVNIKQKLTNFTTIYTQINSSSIFIQFNSVPSQTHISINGSTSNIFLRSQDKCIFQGFNPLRSFTFRPPSTQFHLIGIKNTKQGMIKENLECVDIGSVLTIRFLQEFGRKVLRIKTQAVATTTQAPAVSSAAPERKKTLRKGSVIITGASSGLGLATAKALAESGKWHVIMACRDFLKAERAAKSVGMSKENYTVMHLDLASLDSVRQFVNNFKQSGRPLDVLVCNAAVYQPTAREPSFTADGIELSVGINHLGHFLLSRMLLDDMKQSDYPSKRLIIVGSITGNTNTLAGNVPPKANLGDMRGLAGGLSGLNSSTMIDGGDFDGAKAYKDSKICNMLTMQEFHRRYHEETGITFASLYPGCIATTGLFREHIPLFRLLFPPFQKFITKGYVSEEESGKRLAQVIE